MGGKTSYATVKAWRKANPDKVAEQARRYRAKHPDKVQAIRERYRAKDDGETYRQLDREAKARKRKRDPEGERRRQLEWRERREKKLAKEAGRPRADVCDICGEEGQTVFDHCHNHGHFRGWLCDRCNRTLGQVKDSATLLRALADYLEATGVEDHDEAA